MSSAHTQLAPNNVFQPTSLALRDRAAAERERYAGKHVFGQL